MGSGLIRNTAVALLKERRKHLLDETIDGTVLGIAALNPPILSHAPPTPPTPAAATAAPPGPHAASELRDHVLQRREQPALESFEHRESDGPRRALGRGSQ